MTRAGPRRTQCDDHGERRARVEGWIARVRAFWRDPTNMSRRARAVALIAAESGLSPEMVRWAVDHVLELDPSVEEIDALIARAPRRSAVAVVLAANVFTAPLRAIAWAFAQSPRVVVRRSRRGSAFLAPFADAISLQPLGDDPEADLVDAIAALGAGGAIHAYGGTAMLAVVDTRVRAHTDLATELHGPGFGAIVARSDEVVAAADAIAYDVAAFDQRGCLSPRVALVSGAGAPAAEALHRALTRIDRELPRGRLDVDEKGELLRACDAARYAGRVLEGDGHAVLAVDDAAKRWAALPLGPVGRCLPVVEVADARAAVRLLAPLSARLTTLGVGLADRDAIAELLPSGVRVARLGAMQRPRFDGPVDLRPLVS